MNSLMSTAIPMSIYSPTADARRYQRYFINIFRGLFSTTNELIPETVPRGWNFAFQGIICYGKGNRRQGIGRIECTVEAEIFCEEVSTEKRAFNSDDADRIIEEDFITGRECAGAIGVDYA